MKKKFIISSLLGALGLSIIGINTGFAFSLFGNDMVEEPLKSVSFSSGGDMQGSTHGMSVNLLRPRELAAFGPEAEGKALVCFEDAAWHHHCIAVKEYLVPVSLLEDIKNIFNDNKLARCEKASQSQLMVLDAATSSYSFDFEKRRISFSSTQDLPRGTYQVLKEIRQCVEAACAKGQRLPGLVLLPDENGDPPIRNAIVKNRMNIKVVGYQGRTLSISIGNGFEKEQKVSLEAKLLQENQTVAEDRTNETLDLAGNYNYDYSWTLDKRLAAGQYRLTLGGYTTEFEIK